MVFITDLLPWSYSYAQWQTNRCRRERPCEEEKEGFPLPLLQQEQPGLNRVNTGNRENQ